MIFTLTYDSSRNALIFPRSCHDFENFGQTSNSSYENHGANNHKQIEFSSPENHNSKEPQILSTPTSTSASSLASNTLDPIILQIPISQTMVVNRMDAIISTRYAPLVLPVGLHSLSATNYMKFFPRYNGERDVTVEEDLVSFYTL
jgi:hypothetical protein